MGSTSSSMWRGPPSASGTRWVSCPEHVAIPEPTAQTRGGRYWDPLVTLSFVAASTETIGLLTHVLVLGYHHPLEVVKRYGTLDVASGGRVILGVGVGSLEAEFELLGAPFAGRGARSDDALRAIRTSFAVRAPTYAGPHFEYAGFVVDPSGLQPRVPIWVGGRTRRSLRRALELGDGWIPFGLALDDLRAHARRAAPRWRRAGPEPSRSTSCSPPSRPSTPSAAPATRRRRCGPTPTSAPPPCRCVSATTRRRTTSSNSRP